MHDELMETFYLLSIANLAQGWPELHSLRDRAMEKLRVKAKTPAHTTPAEAPQMSRPIAPMRPALSKKDME